MVGEIERLRLRVLEEPHAALAQRPRQSDEKLARTKAAAEAIDHAAGVESLSGAVAPLQLSCAENLEERRPALVRERHQRSQIALLHEAVSGFEARHVGLGDGRRARPMLHRSAQVVVAIKLFKLLASLDGAAQERPHPALRLPMRLHAINAFFHVLLGELRDHNVDRLRPSGQELARAEPGCRLFAIDTFFDHDDVEPASDRRVGRAEPGKPAARDQEVAGQIFIRG